MIAEDETDFVPAPKLPLHPPKVQRIVAPVGPVADVPVIAEPETKP